MIAEKEAKTPVYNHGKGKYFIISINSLSLTYAYLYNYLL